MDYSTIFLELHKTIEKIGKENFITSFLKTQDTQISTEVFFQILAFKFKGKEFPEIILSIQTAKEKKIAENISSIQLENIVNNVCEIMVIDKSALFYKGYNTSITVKNARIIFFGTLKSFYGFTAKECAKHYQFSVSQIQIYCRNFLELDTKIADHKKLLEKYELLITKIKHNEH